MTGKKETHGRKLIQAGERFVWHFVAVVVGFVLMVIGLAMGVTMVLLPVGIVVGIAGVLIFIWGLFGDLGRDGAR